MSISRWIDFKLLIGVDVEEISRFSKKKYKNNENFYKKIFLPNEIKYCLEKNDPYPHFAVRFCAKEAAIKALEKNTIELKDIEVIIINKKPSIKILNKFSGKVSMSHSKKTAIAFVMIDE